MRVGAGDGVLGVGVGIGELWGGESGLFGGGEGGGGEGCT